MFKLVDEIRYSRYISWGLILAGLLVTLIGLFYLWHATSSQSWPSTSGNITRSELDTFSEGGKKKYIYQIRYQYQVNGTQYESKRVEYGKFGNDREDAEKMLSRFPLGANVEVFYDQKNPDRSTLIVGANIFVFLLPISGFFFLLTGVYYLRRSLRRAQK